VLGRPGRGGGNKQPPRLAPRDEANGAGDHAGGLQDDERAIFGEAGEGGRLGDVRESSLDLNPIVALLGILLADRLAPDSASLLFGGGVRRPPRSLLWDEAMSDGDSSWFWSPRTLSPVLALAMLLVASKSGRASSTCCCAKSFEIKSPSSSVMWARRAKRSLQLWRIRN